MESLIALNLLLCAFGGFLCVCRLRYMNPATKYVIRFRYVMWFTAFSASGISWLFGYPASVFQILLGACVIADLGLGFNAWKNGVPKYAQS